MKRKRTGPGSARQMKAQVLLLQQILGALVVKQGGEIQLTRTDLDIEEPIEMHVSPEGVVLRQRNRPRIQLAQKLPPGVQ